MPAIEISPSQQRLEAPVLEHVRTNFVRLKQDWSVREAITTLRQSELGDGIFYFYVIDDAERLTGVIPTRRLLISRDDQLLSEIMVRRVVAIPHTATVFDACEFFVLHKFFALPVVDEQRRVVGVVDISLLTEEVLDVDDTGKLDDVFDALGFHIAQLRNASPFTALRFRFPWLLATIASGVACAALAGLFAKTLSELLILAFFLPLVLGLGESVSIQSMALTIQALRASRPTPRWYFTALRREASTAGLLGMAAGAVVAAIVWLWQRNSGAALAIGGSVMLSLLSACLLGLSIPSLLHALRLDPKIAAGPVTLAISDLVTLLFYFGIATLLLAGHRL
jgi:magnesium transporter